MLKDEKIIELYWQRSEYAIVETEKKYGGLCKHIASNVLCDLQDTEECVQDTYMEVWGLIPEERPTYLKAFICKITRYLALKRLEYKTAKKRHSNGMVAIEELEQIAEESRNLTESLELEELVGEINQYLGQLQAKKRKILVRRYFYFDSISEIATRYEINENTVKSILAREGKKLGVYLRKRGYANE